jgi:hypothetical protein
MLTEIYIEALLVYEELADQVLDAWNKRKINDLAACVSWQWIVSTGVPQEQQGRAPV